MSYIRSKQFMWRMFKILQKALWYFSKVEIYLKNIKCTKGWVETLDRFFKYRSILLNFNFYWIKHLYVYFYVLYMLI